jgi:cellulose biosynthesis protein BcsQ
MIVCWSTKGGSGTTVVSIGLGLAMARQTGNTAIADLCGDVATALAADIDETRPGLRQWLASPATVPYDGLRRLTVEVMDGLELMPPGPPATGSADAIGQSERLALAFEGANLVVDAGMQDRTPEARALIEVATTSLLVVRPCFLAIKAASKCTQRADGLVLIDEPGRALDAADIEDALGIPIAATLRWDSNVARRVDAGRLKGRPIKGLKPLDRLAESLSTPQVGRLAG